MTDVVTAFVAYSSRDQSLSKTIFDAVSRANAKNPRVRYEPWESNDVAGTPLISPIIERIEESSFIVADITYLNPNVVYEIGYAIGSGRRAFLIRHSSTGGDKAFSQKVGIFDTLGYEEYQDEDSLSHRLSSFIETKPLAVGVGLDRLAPVYVIEPTVKGQVAATMTSRLKKQARYRYRSFNSSEDVRLSAVDAINQVSSSAGILLSLQEESTQDCRIDNLRSLFVAGLAHGLNKPTLILCPAQFNPPLDVRDYAKTFYQPSDINAHIHDFALEITDYLQQTDPVQVKTETLLQSLRIGDPTAENEMATLGEYYLPTDEYSRTLNGDVNLVLGRKGSGKTALFIQARDRIRSDKRNIVVDLKPEGYQLLKLKEDILAYLGDGARQHLITAFWEYMLLLEVAYKILEKDRHTYKHNHELYDLYVDLENAYRVEDSSVEGDFSERLMILSSRIADNYQATYGDQHERKLLTEQISELVYAHDVRELERRISAYLEKKESVWVLFDNLDKGWSTKGIDVIDTIALRCLIDAGRKLERDMQRSGHEFHCVIFIRNDVYEHLMEHSPDYGKEMRAVLDWTESDLLREMLRLRLVSGLEESSHSMAFDQIWRTICVSHHLGEETSNYMIERSLMRPRNLLKIFSHCRGFANNLNHQQITGEDIEKGLLAYSHDLLIELDRELVDVFPQARDLLYHFIDAKSTMVLEELSQLIQGAGVEEHEAGRVIDFLLYYGIIGLRSLESTYYIYDVNYDPKMLRIRALRAGVDAEYIVNIAFWPALGVQG